MTVLVAAVVVLVACVGLVVWAWVLTGRIRALRFDEQPTIPEESECAQPDENCKLGCFGKGWSKRHTTTGVVIPCKCVKRRA